MSGLESFLLIGIIIAFFLGTSVGRFSVKNEIATAGLRYNKQPIKVLGYCYYVLSQREFEEYETYRCR